ncbi:hypothetical protein I4F81_010739 [Pyropia yezoensis]|uniref:Uncharacterized protein n=1 Tax=Pyropia yezoensis TaxID=2788 RepID=A0ACC3CDA0_PYRYE|nr:hypothetical protein I4F81_010739 [Neopyropia yezoensis]
MASLVGPPCDGALECVSVAVDGVEYGICTATSPAGGACGVAGARCATGTVCVESGGAASTPCVPSFSLCDGAATAPCVRGLDACAGGAAAGVCRPTRVGDPCDLGTPTGEGVCGGGLACVRPGPRDTDGSAGALLRLEVGDDTPDRCVAVKAAGDACEAGGLDGCAAASTGALGGPPTLLCVAGVCVGAATDAAAASSRGDECIEGGRFEDVTCGDGTPCTSSNLFRSASQCLAFQTAVGGACSIADGRPCGFGETGQLVCAADGTCAEPPPVPAGGRCVGNNFNCADAGFSCLPPPASGSPIFPPPPAGGGEAVCLRGRQTGETCGDGADACAAAPFEACVRGVCVSIFRDGGLPVGAPCGLDVGLCVAGAVVLSPGRLSLAVALLRRLTMAASRPQRGTPAGQDGKATLLAVAWSTLTTGSPLYFVQRPMGQRSLNLMQAAISETRAALCDAEETKDDAVLVDDYLGKRPSSAVADWNVEDVRIHAYGVLVKSTAIHKRCESILSMLIEARKLRKSDR